MEFFRDTKIEFMKYRRRWVVVSAALLLVSVFAVLVRGKLNVGIDFAGGTQLTLKFKTDPTVDRLRDIIAAAGVGEVQIQRFGDAGSGEVLIKAPTVDASEEGSRDQIIDALDEAFNGSVSGLDLNRAGVATLADLLLELDTESLGFADPEAARAHHEGVAAKLLSIRRSEGIVTDWTQFESLDVDAATLEAVQLRAALGEFAVLGAENVGPQIGSELRLKGIMAIGFSLLGMLAYIWFRFELRYGIGALVAVLHDVMITLGLFSLTGFEFNLTTIAGFLTLVGYSVNDSVVVFDRVRENLRRSRRSLEETMNLSVNQTLSRTVLTSGTTLLAMGCVLVLGGDVLRGFAFILTVGVIVGTYSSIYVASPFALWWEERFGRQARSQRKESKAVRA